MLATSTPAWFEIPAVDLDRARRFYETVTGAELRVQEMGPMTMAIFPYEHPSTSGALLKADGAEPTTSGSVVYLHVDDIRPALARAEAAGGQTLLPLTALPNDGGVFAQIRDSEGNRVGLYSRR
ncbi:MAG: VOC family protein [Myxococcales bacterium]|nr:VOC family protein [Myxococcales bacterium]